MKKIFFFILLLVLLFANPALAYKFASGSYTGNITDNRNIVISSTTTPSVTSFQPNVVFVKCDSTTSMMWATSAMPADLSFTLSTSTIGAADNIQAFNSTGFQVGTDTRVNANGVPCWYLALANDSNNDLSVGSYTGNGVDPQAITTSPAFQPEVVFVQKVAASAAQMMVNTTGTDLTCYMTAAGCNGDRIQSFHANGFNVGGNAQANQSTNTFYYLTIKAVSGSTASGSYTGNTSDNRQITTLGFKPEFMFIKGNSATVTACGRFKDHSGDDSIITTNIASAVNQIQNFLSNGFEVGTAACTNENTITMYWYAIKELPVVENAAFPQIVTTE